MTKHLKIKELQKISKVKELQNIQSQQVTRSMNHQTNGHHTKGRKAQATISPKMTEYFRHGAECSDTGLGHSPVMTHYRAHPACFLSKSMPVPGRHAPYLQKENDLLQLEKRLFIDLTISSQFTTLIH